MHSKYLESLSKEDYENLKKELASIQSCKCYICQKDIDLEIQETDVDHIVPLANKGKDDKSNFALTHASCNRSKSDANLNIARILYKLKNLQDEVQSKENRSASLKDLLKIEDGSKYNFQYKIENDELVYSFSEIGDTQIYRTKIFEDALSKEKSCFIEVPLEYLYHDNLINPRGINSSISLLVKEFSKGNPQLHLSLARINEDKIQNEIVKCSTMEQAFNLIKSYPLIGNFMAYQLVTDINYSEVTNWKENEFTVAGPGSLRGIKKCFISKGNMSNEDIIRYMYNHQEEEFKRLNLDFKKIGNRPLQLIDCQNIFCELDKYCRQALPDLKSNRTKIKKHYVPKSTKIEYFYPPKWNINLLKD